MTIPLYIQPTTGDNAAIDAIEAKVEEHFNNMIEKAIHAGEAVPIK